jgi:hypothetical protein
LSTRPRLERSGFNRAKERNLVDLKVAGLIVRLNAELGHSVVDPDCRLPMRTRRQRPI